MMTSSIQLEYFYSLYQKQFYVQKMSRLPLLKNDIIFSKIEFADDVTMLTSLIRH